jgi:hypothetical protein
VSFLIDTIELNAGKASLVDASLSRPFHTTLGPIDLTIAGLGNAAEQRATFSLSAATEAKEAVRADGELGLTPLTVDVKMGSQGVVLAKYAPYYRDLVRFGVTGKLDAGGRAYYAAGTPAPTIRVSEAGLSLSGLKLRMEDESEDFLQIPALTVSGTQADVGKRTLTVGSIATRKGYFRVTRSADGAFPLRRLMREAMKTPAPAAHATAPPAARAAAEKPWVVALTRATLDQYRMLLDDRSVSPAVTMALDDVRVTGEKISTAKGTTGKANVSFTLDRTAAVSLASSVGLDPPKADGRLELKRVPLKQYASYYRNAVLFDVQDGLLDLSTDFAVAQPGETPTVKLAGLGLGLENLRLRTREDGQEFLVVPSLSVRNTNLDVGERTLEVGELATQHGALQVNRSADGKVNLARLVPTPASTPAPTPATASPSLASVPAPAPEAAPAGGSAPAPASAPVWRAAVASLAVEDYAISVSDKVPADPVALHLDALRIKAQNVSTEPGTTGSLALGVQVEKTGSVAVQGSVGIAPVAAELQLDVKQVDIRPFQPYFTDRVKVVVNDGHVSTAGSLTLATADQGAPKIGYSGNLLVGNLASADKQNGEDVLRWETLSLDGLDVATEPMRVHLTRAALAGFYARTVVQPDGRLNLVQIIKNDGGDASAAAPEVSVKPTRVPTSAPASAAAPASDFKLDEIALQGGKIEFTDRSITPNYSATLVEMGGRVSGLSSEETAMADVDLRGRYGNSAPLEITGKMNPLRENLYADLKIRYRDMDLSSVSPYSGKYIGYTIQKGKLSLDLDYLIDGRKLDSKNRVVLDQFTLGDKVESPTATQLPVALAIGLLKDRKGEIHLDLPVSGSLDDPKFSVWGVVTKFLGNLIAKAATSPMTLLGALVGGGGGEELRNAEFEYGTTTLTEESGKRIEMLAKAMRERPALKLDVTAYVDPERDREALHKAAFDKKVRAQKALDVSRRDGRRVSAEEVSVEPAEYEKYLRQAYGAEKFPKPRNALGLTKSLPVAEMEKLMYAHIQVTDEELRALAAARAQAAKDELVAGQVATDRIFVLEPRPAPPVGKGDARLSRVDFAIKRS